LGLRAGILTSFGPDFPVDALPSDVEVARVFSDRTTIFEHAPSAEGRRLVLVSRAADIEEGHLPAPWRDVPLVLLCPVANEVDPALAAGFPDGSLGVAPQGWMRARGAGGAVTPQRWEDADLVLPHAQCLVVSAEDIAGIEKEALDWFQEVPLAAVTRGAEGALLFVNGERYHVDPDAAREVDPTGAGDVFATVLLIEYQRDGNPWEAAAAAACAAAARVEVQGPDGIPDRAALERRLAAYRRRHGG
ncbi:MAG TPA: PfkB family carbohydrate kinase, partial [Methylomirabilota bacterium]|nr:PfkB family carbohydrate kinase [Methylomirabilota bacterium]